MAKQEKEIERWVTMNGVRVPIYKDGSIGGPKELRDKIKAKDKKVQKQVDSRFKSKEKSKEGKSSFDKARDHEVSNLQNAKENVDMLKEQLKKHPNDMHTAEIKTRLKKAQAEYKKLQSGDTSDSNFKTAKEHDADKKTGKKETLNQKAFREATERRKEKAAQETKEKAQAAKDKKAGVQKFVVDRDDIGTSTLVNAEVGSKISFEGETWEKTGKDTWQNKRNGLSWESRDVYRQRIEGESGMEVKMTAPKSSSSKESGNKKKSTSRESAINEAQSRYKDGEHDVVLMQKDGQYKIAKDLHESEYAEKKGWTRESFSAAEKKAISGKDTGATSAMKGKTRAQKDIANNEDIKEKQIAANKKEKDSRGVNNQVSDRVKSYQDKFLKKRSAEEIGQIRDNIEKGSNLTGYTESDMIAMRAIEAELDSRGYVFKDGKWKKIRKRG